MDAKQRIPWDEDVCLEAIFQGNLEMLQWLWKTTPPIVCMNA